MEKTYGQIAFEAYTAARGGKNHDGSPTPPWEALGDGVREGWEGRARQLRERRSEDGSRKPPMVPCEHCGSHPAATLALVERIAALEACIEPIGLSPSFMASVKTEADEERQAEAPTVRVEALEAGTLRYEGPICASAEDFGLEPGLTADQWATLERLAAEHLSQTHWSYNRLEVGAEVSLAHGVVWQVRAIYRSSSGYHKHVAVEGRDLAHAYTLAVAHFGGGWQGWS